PNWALTFAEKIEITQDREAGSLLVVEPNETEDLHAPCSHPVDHGVAASSGQ
ncbi:Hypothetical predicted protein, partial [Marmota monax]